MSFLRDDNLTFHRFSTDMSLSSRRPSSEDTIDNAATAHENDTTPKNTITLNNNPSNFNPAIWTTDTKAIYSTTIDTNNEFQYVPPHGSPRVGGYSQPGGSTSKLLPADDQSTKQSKWSMFRGVILCICLNATYANIVRFPRELERHGISFLFPYCLILLVVGLPIVLLEVALGQFLGQESAHAWRTSPFFKGASIVGRLSSWLGAIWTSMQAVLAIVYVGMLILKPVPFSQCSSLKRESSRYITIGKSGEECIKQTLFTPVWTHSLYFALLTMSLVVLWILSMICTYSSKTLRRSIMILGGLALAVLTFLTGWSITAAIDDQSILKIPLLFDTTFAVFADSDIWFDALVQVIFSTMIGVGVMPVLTGKYLYKGDAVQTSVTYIFFNVIVCAISSVYFVIQFNNPTTIATNKLYPEMKPLVAVYDVAVINAEPLLSRLLPGLSYLVMILASMLTIAIFVYTASRYFKRHPNYVLSMLGLLFSIAALMGPDLSVSRLLDTRVVGPLVVCAIIFDVISVTWVYGADNLYTDLEFSIGRPIFRLWLILWCATPPILIGFLTWWAVMVGYQDLWIVEVPRWSPIVLGMTIIVVFACVAVSKQVDYNFCSMIIEAGKPAKDWGPTDPLVRHAWKQWRCVCEDTGERDFTLRRRGTRDYTHSIKKGQYQRKFANVDSKLSTPGSGSPNYADSIFGDSAIGEDISVDKYPTYQSQNDAGGFVNETKSHRLSNRSSVTGKDESRSSYLAPTEKNHQQMFYVKRMSGDSRPAVGQQIKIVPQHDSGKYRNSAVVKNPMGRSEGNGAVRSTSYPSDSYGSFGRDVPAPGSNGGGDHYCWRKFSVNSEEYSTEL